MKARQWICGSVFLATVVIAYLGDGLALAAACMVAFALGAVLSRPGP